VREGSRWVRESESGRRRESCFTMVGGCLAYAVWALISPRVLNSGNIKASSCSSEVDLWIASQHFRSRTFEHSAPLSKRAAETYVALVKHILH
jgi:hypothetical protein